MPTTTEQRRGRGRPKTELTATQERLKAKALTSRNAVTKAEEAADSALVAAYKGDVPVAHLAEEFGVDVRTVRNWLRAAGVELTKKR